MRAWVGLGVAALLAAILLAGCPQVCTAIGCLGEAARIEVDRTASTSQLADGLFRVCRNSTRCSERVIRLSGGDLVLSEITRDELMTRLNGTKLESHIVVIVDSNNENELADGDEYSLQLLDRMGAVVEEWHWVADYQESYPNGRDCDDDAPCRQVELN